MIYLQGDPFTDAHRALAEQVGRYLAPLVAALVARADAASDLCRPLRERLGCPELVGRSRALNAVLNDIERAAPLRLPVLLLGDSGTGKSAFAAVIHRNSNRQGPFVTVNCPALPETLFERELFGVERGAYTGADRSADGLIHAARGGTLFLEEVGDLSPGNQAKLLHFLEEGRYRRVGGVEELRAEVRVLSATNRDLEADPSFRADLYYRLAGFPIRVPSLSERREDLVLLARSIIDPFARAQRMPAFPLSPGAVQELMIREWPGNVRQLANVLHRGMVVAHSEQAEQLDSRHLFPDLDQETEVITWQQHIRRFQRDLLAESLASVDWNVAEASRRLDLSRSRIYELLAAFNLERR